MPIPAVMVVVISAISVLGYIKVIDALWFKPLIKERVGGYSKLMTYIPFILALVAIALGILNPYMTQWLSEVVNCSLSPEGINAYINEFIKVSSNLIKYLGGT